jgi:hypothetical protein
MALRTQTPTAPNEWLYQDRGEDRYFTTFVHLGKEEPKWAECTNEEKVAWEELNKVEEPLPEEVEELQETVQ